MADRVVRSMVCAAAAAVVAGWGTPARADKIIHRPGQGPDYSVEIEPHALFGPFEPPGDSAGTSLGAGLRVSIPILREGFAKRLNDSVAIGFGLDWVHYDGGGAAVGGCAEFVPGPNDTSICRRVADHGGPADYYIAPIVLQYDLWLYDEFSAFAEPGLSLHYQTQEHDDGDVGFDGVFQVGGRWHFARFAALTLRAGYPTLSLGVSFLL